MGCVESSEAFLSDHQRAPDQSTCRSDLLVSLGRVGSEADGGKRAFDDIGCSQVPPVWFWEVEEGKHTIPVSIKGLDCLRERVLISCDELPAELPGIARWSRFMICVILAWVCRSRAGFRPGIRSQGGSQQT